MEIKEARLDAGLYIVSTPIGNLEDITLRALRILQEVDQIAAEDTRTAKNLLRHFSIHKPLISLHRDNEEKRLRPLLDALARGERIAVISEAGTPGIADPGFLLIRAAKDAGHRIIPIPGASAVLAALVGSGLPMDRFVFLGFLPQRKSRKKEILQGVQTYAGSLVVYVSPHRALEEIEEIRSILGDREACLAREITKLYEEFLQGRLSTIHADLAAREAIRGEIVLILQGAVESAPPSKLHPSARPLSVENEGPDASADPLQPAQAADPSQVAPAKVESQSPDTTAEMKGFAKGLLLQGLPLKKLAELFAEAYPRFRKQEAYRFLLQSREEEADAPEEPEGIESSKTPETLSKPKNPPVL